MTTNIFNDQVVLVVGGAGFVGSNLCQLILEQSPAELVIVDNLLSADMVNVPVQEKTRFILGSIADDRILSQLPSHIDYAFHLACYHGNQSSIADPLADHDNNTLTSLKLFNHLAGQEGLKKVVYAAAGCAVAEKTQNSAKATPEDAPISLFHDSPYSISKLIGEFYGNYYLQRCELPFVRARFQNVYGPREILGAGRWRGTAHTVWRNVTPSFIFKALHNKALPLDNGGIATRDFIFVEDLARGLIACAADGEPGQAYNLASGKETMIKDLALLINELTNNQTPPEISPARDWDRSGARYGDPTKSREQLNFETKVDLREGLEATVKWTNNNLENIYRCITQHQYFVPEVAEYLSERMN